MRPGYRLAAFAGQRIEVSLDALHVICLRNASGLLASGVGRISSDLPATGEYNITVVPFDDSGRYTMTVAIP